MRRATTLYILGVRVVLIYELLKYIIAIRASKFEKSEACHDFIHFERQSCVDK